MPKNDKKIQDERKKYWLSLQDQQADPSIKQKIQQEFVSAPPLISELQPSRREFLQILGAGLALTSTSCIRRPIEKLVPYVNRPPDIIPGEANYYASSYYDSGEGFSTLIKTREGRPIKIEGNPEAKLLNAQALSPRAQAYLLQLYDPERLQGPKQNLFNKDKSNKETIRASFKELDSSLVKEFKKGQTAILSSRIPSPSTQRIIRAFRSTFKAKHYVWDSISTGDEAQAQKLSYAVKNIPSYNLDQARFIFSLNCDFLGTYLSPTEFQKQFAQARKPGKNMNKLVVLESLMSLTGSNADQRYRLKSQDQLVALMAISAALIEQKIIFVSARFKRLVNSYQTAWSKLQIPTDKWQEWAKELGQNKGQSVILFGGLRTQTTSSIETHILVNFLNSALGNDGKTVNFSQAYTYKFGSHLEMRKLISDLNQGRIKRLIIHATNPLYSYPDQEALLKAIKKAELVVYTGDRIDETGSHADYVVPDSHPLEKWSDWEFKKNIFTIQQASIRPLYNTRAFEDSLIVWIQSAGSKRIRSKNFYQYIKNYWTYQHATSFWNKFLKTGIAGSSKVIRSRSRPVRAQALARLKFYKEKEASTPYVLNLYETSNLKQGDLANVAWLMEFPDPVTKICWDNYLCMSPSTAYKNHFTEGAVCSLTVNNKTLLAPVHIQPGQEDSTLALSVGYGRTLAGFVGNNKGVNAYPLASQNHNFQFSACPVKIKKTNKFIPLANVQGHHSMEGRDIVLETSLKKFREDPASGIPHHKKATSMWSKQQYSGHKWGMVIDLNSCNGCGTCILACQSENNIPTVGKKLVLQGREMHWIRVDRYYQGDPAHPLAVHQPIVCMHCDNAPCETVCPVVATVHSDEGTNDMIYNRCVGTRYCSNNCPYKVRRFNWFDYTKQKDVASLKMVLNPDVTVRHRGVMEKCSFCIQRIQEGKARAKKEDRKLQDGDIQTACQQSCPAQAIVFGDLNDPNSRVSKAFHAKNSYALLDDMLNTKPAVKYQTKIRNSLEQASTNKLKHK